ncbi:hypothetical protein HYPSUDRAFT_685083 [Hypholoma sublateritium FD-334 SS-4]|uniref:Secreted protein n=1 Tax=Hypholoma sublateritium (strain FD-334 SS-4) TaxID=945553 RepID=A0A0D2NS33_HYPSF|nr:hypothetical protein HYPSUDRAFT_685083 [Hypholoma sublateritium FD-334 SS-4]
MTPILTLLILIESVCVISAISDDTPFVSLIVFSQSPSDIFRPSPLPIGTSICVLRLYRYIVRIAHIIPVDLTCSAVLELHDIHPADGAVRFELPLQASRQMITIQSRLIGPGSSSDVCVLAALGGVARRQEHSASPRCWVGGGRPYKATNAQTIA